MFLFSHSDNWYMADVQKLLWMRIPGGCQLIIEKTVRPIFPPAPRDGDGKGGLCIMRRLPCRCVARACTLPACTVAWRNTGLHFRPAVRPGDQVPRLPRVGLQASEGLCGGAAAGAAGPGDGRERPLLGRGGAHGGGAVLPEQRQGRLRAGLLGHQRRHATGAPCAARARPACAPRSCALRQA